LILSWYSGRRNAIIREPAGTGSSNPAKRFLWINPDKRTMTGRWYLLSGALLLLIILAAGCTSLSVGTVTYGNGNLTIGIAGPASPQDIGVQVTVYAVDEYSQHVLFTTGTTATLTGGETTVEIPAQLSPGKYKVYVYLIRDGERETAVIRDITV